MSFLRFSYNLDIGTKFLKTSKKKEVCLSTTVRRILEVGAEEEGGHMLI